MIDLQDFQFEILPDEDELDGVGFGIFLDVSLDDGGFDPGTAEQSTQDQQNPGDGSTMFGVDQLLGETWAWNLHVNREDVPGALETLRLFRKTWRARAAAAVAGKLSVIRYQMNGEVRRTYGRARRFAAPPDNKILNGYIPVTVDFKTALPVVFDDVEQSTTLNFVVESSGGLVFPTTFPASPLPDGQREGGIVVGGDAPTYPVATFVGPITNPWMQWAGRKWTFNVTVPSGQSFVVDTRPWKQTLTLAGQSLPGAMGRRQYMRDMTLTPGGYEVIFGGNSVEGTAQFIFAWRNAYEGY